MANKSHFEAFQELLKGVKEGFSNSQKAKANQIDVMMSMLNIKRAREQDELAKQAAQREQEMFNVNYPLVTETVQGVNIPAPEGASPFIQEQAQALSIPARDVTYRTKRETVNPNAMTFEQRVALKKVNANTLDEQGIKDAIEAIKANPAKFYDYPSTAKRQLIPELHKALVEVVPKTQIKSAADAAASAVSGVNAVTLAKENLGDLIGATTAPEAWTQYATRSLGSFFKTDADAAVYNSFIEGMIPIVARAVGHTGVLTEPDYEHTKQLFPTFKDTVEIANRKLDNISNLIEGNKKARLDIFSGVKSTGENITKSPAKLKNDPMGLFK